MPHVKKNMESDMTAKLGETKYPISRSNVCAFFALMGERHAIHLRRKSGQLPPWTDDPILQKYRFCNVYRVHDRSTQFLLSQVIEPSKEGSDCFFRILLFRLFNRESTWLQFSSHFKEITLGSFNREAYLKVLQPLYDKGERIYAPRIRYHLPNCFLEVLLSRIIFSCWNSSKR